MNEGQGVFEGKSTSAYSGIVRRLLKKKFSGQTLPLSQLDLARFRAEQAGEYAYPSRSLDSSTLEYSAKMKAAPELHHLLETAEYSHWAPDRKNHAVATLGFDYYKTKFIVDGHLFEGLINIANSEKGRIFYDITNIKEILDLRGKPATGLAQVGSHIQESPDTSILPSIENRNPKIQKSQGSSFDQLLRDGGYAEQAGERKEQKNNVSKKTQYSLNPNFERAFDQWVKHRNRKGNVSLWVGRTSDALKSIGVRDSDIYWDTGKIRKIMDKHAGMTVDVLKQVPQILEDPILIMQSKQVGSRITMFGEVMDAQGKPVLAVLELQPNERNSALRLDTIKVASAYGKDRVQNFLNTSDILYLNPDKKRTNAWLALTRLRLPFIPTKYGFIKTITYFDTNSNPQKAQGSSFDQLLRDAGYTEQAGRLAKAVERYGAIERGEMAARDVRLPTQMDENTRVRRFARTAAEFSILTDQQAGEIGKAVADDKSARCSAHSKIPVLPN